MARGTAGNPEWTGSRGDAGLRRHRPHFGLAVSGFLRLRRALDADRADGRCRPGGHRHVRLADRINAPVHPATDRVRPGQRFGTIRRDPGRRHGIGDLFHRRFHDPTGNTAVDASEPLDQAKGKARWLDKDTRLADAARQPLPSRGVISQELENAKQLPKPCILRPDRCEPVCSRGPRWVVDRRRYCRSRGSNEQFAATLIATGRRRGGARSCPLSEHPSVARGAQFLEAEKLGSAAD